MFQRPDIVQCPKRSVSFDPDIPIAIPNETLKRRKAQRLNDAWHHIKTCNTCEGDFVCKTTQGSFPCQLSHCGIPCPGQIVVHVRDARKAKAMSENERVHYENHSDRYDRFFDKKDKKKKKGSVGTFVVSS